MGDRVFAEYQIRVFRKEGELSVQLVLPLGARTRRCAMRNSSFRMTCHEPKSGATAHLSILSGYNELHFATRWFRPREPFSTSPVFGGLQTNSAPPA